MNNEIKMVMGGYLDENDRLMDRTELNKRIKSIREELETTKKLLEEAKGVVQLTLYDIQNCGFISFMELRLKSFLAKLNKE